LMFMAGSVPWEGRSPKRGFVSFLGERGPNAV
jgi:hypothetical protein